VAYAQKYKQLRNKATAHYKSKHAQHKTNLQFRERVGD